MDFPTCFIIFNCSSDYWIKKSLAIFPFGDMSHCLFIFFFDACVCSVCVEALSSVTLQQDSALGKWIFLVCFKNFPFFSILV